MRTSQTKRSLPAERRNALVLFMELTFWRSVLSNDMQAEDTKCSNIVREIVTENFAESGILSS